MVSPRSIATFFLVCASALHTAYGQTNAQAQTGVTADRSLSDWLHRTHEATKRRAYEGTFVVSSALGMTSAKIWAVCDGNQQMERVEALTGPPRSTLRHNSQVVTFMRDLKLARSEQRESLGFFPAVTPESAASLDEYYSAQKQGQERVAGVDAEIMLLTPRDQLRYGYRVWSEKKTGLIVKVQTLDEQQRVIEQAAFSELKIDAPVKMEQISAQMRNTAGYKFERDNLVKTTAAAEGWGMRSIVPGYRPNGCHKRAPEPAAPAGTTNIQWVFTDGLASVSLFIENFDPKRHREETVFTHGPTTTLTRRVESHWWLVAMGEVPATTLRGFASALYRR